MEWIEKIWGTFLLRPYVFVFLAAFLFSSIVAMGRRRTLVFWLGTWFLAFLSEFASTRTGFPYGWYFYTGSTADQELFISNVPFMDSLSYSFLLFASFSMALFFLSPLKVESRSVQVVDHFALRNSWRLTFLTAFFMMMIDVVIDPVAHQGAKWFLGKIYDYRSHGHYFNIPLSNAFGWFLVGFLATRIYQIIEKKFLGPNYKDAGLRRFRFATLMGAGIYFGVLLFNIGVTLYIRDYALAIADMWIFMLPTVLFVLKFFDPRSRATKEEWSRHRHEFQIDVKS